MLPDSSVLISASLHLFAWILPFDKLNISAVFLAFW